MKADEIKLDEIGEKILSTLKHYGTNTQGAEYKQKQQARHLSEMFQELHYAKSLLEKQDFKHVKVSFN